MRYKNINTSFFIRNREKFRSKMPDGSVSVFASNSFTPRNADGSSGFVQNSTFYYLTGIDQEDSILIIVKGEGEWLFIQETSELIKIWDGEKLNKDEAHSVSGIQNIEWTELFWEVLDGLVKDKKELFLYRDNVQASKFPSFRSFSTFIYQKVGEKFPLLEVRNPASVTDQLRLYKEDVEVEAIKKAIQITHHGFMHAAKKMEPGKYEFEIEAELSYVFTTNRSRRHAFLPIIASGPNACVLHYIQNNRLIGKDELVLMDFGAEYANYNADMTRVLPSGGKFTSRQKNVYDSVLFVLNEVQKLMVKGNTIGNLKKQTSDLIGEELVKLNLLSAGQLKSQPELVNKYFPHGVSHSLGLDVHDVGDRDTPLDVGMVMTCEPGIYIPEEGIGVRLENDILITPEGNVNLMEGIPLETEEIENLMNL